MKLVYSRQVFAAVVAGCLAYRRTLLRLVLRASLPTESPTCGRIQTLHPARCLVSWPCRVYSCVYSSDFRPLSAIHLTVKQLITNLKLQSNPWNDSQANTSTDEPYNKFLKTKCFILLSSFCQGLTAHWQQAPRLERAITPGRDQIYLIWIDNLVNSGRLYWAHGIHCLGSQPFPFIVHRSFVIKQNFKSSSILSLFL